MQVREHRRQACLKGAMMVTQRIVEHDAAGVRFIAIKATSYEALRENILSFYNRHNREIGGKPFPLLPRPVVIISARDLPCGTVFEYQSLEDIPADDTPCPCGDPTHWMIWYEQHD